MKNILVFLALILFASCVSSNKITRRVTLDFSKCVIPISDEEYGHSYKYVKISALKGYKLEKITPLGCKWCEWCEYRFIYKDGSVFAVSTYFINGTRLNRDNLNDIGINTLAVHRSLEPVDTIKYEGRQKNGNYWLQYVLGDIAIGYANATIEKKEYFDQMIISLQKRNNKK